MHPKTILALSLPALVTTTVTHAHIGDEIYPFYELLDEDLARIDLTDASVDDWLEVVGEPSLVTSDFWRGAENWPSDPTTLDVHVWLAWHQRSSTLWVAVEAFDDRYIAGYFGDGTEGWPSCTWWDGCMDFFIDGDHSGGRYRRFPAGDHTEEELELLNFRQAQRYWMPVDPEEGHIRFHGAGDWPAMEPYAAGGGGALGSNPAIWILEMKVTPFDDLLYNDESLSKTSDLYPGKTIGFELRVYDADERPPIASSSPYLLTPMELSAAIFASHFVDGLLLGAGEDPSRYDDRSAVEPTSWGRIKASFK